MYRINELAKLAGITTRTLRYYDQKGLLIPSYKDSNGYRYYNEENVNLLQQIMFYKELGYSLDQIIVIFESDSFNQLNSLYEHLSLLNSKKEHIEGVIELVAKTIEMVESGEKMSDEKKFEAFKQNQVKENIEKYGKELNETYDAKFIQQSNEKYLKKSKYEMKIQSELTEKLNIAIIKAMDSNDPCSDASMEMCELHKEWICFYWPSYNKEHHLSLVEMYTLDERFTKYYDKIKVGAAQFLLKAMKNWINT